MTLATTSSSTTMASATANNGAEGVVGFDLYRLDCAVDALRDAHLSQSDRAELARIAANLADIMEPMQ